jgi:hypothetical protein
MSEPMIEILKTSNIQHPISSAQFSNGAGHWMFGVECSMFDVPPSFPA